MFDKANLKELLLVFSLILTSIVNLNKIGGGFYGPMISTVVLLFVGGIYLYSYLSDKHPKKVLEQFFTLKLLDKEGMSAKLEKKEKFKVTGNNITRLIETGHRSDGDIEDVYTSIGSCNNELSPKHFGYIINLVHPLTKKEHTRIFSYLIKNSFKNNQEYWLLRNNSSIKKAKARIEFPVERPPKNISARIMSDTEGIDISDKLIKIEENPNYVYEIDLEKKSGIKTLILWDW